MYIENPKDTTQKKLLELINESSKVAGIKSQHTKVSYISIHEQSEKKTTKTIPFTIASKAIEFLRNKFNQGGEIPLL